MPNETDNDAIFAHALGLPEEERDAYLAQACGEDTGLRDRMAKLLLAYGDSFSSANTLSDSQDLRGTVIEQPGTAIGRYTLLQQIGEGGFGVVFMAEQEKPVRRKVALKIVKAGMDSAEIIKRFEAERQALAMMDHPHIARVFDAGTTESGRPYFVMEMVQGEPITKYCDDRQMRPRERLNLFMDVCQGLQHAHQKGIIHRDIKPSNILVSTHDGKPVAKLIDFGIAKATDRQSVDATLMTQMGQMVGTPVYMSPEQAAGYLQHIDTRTDVYALGILLYELLTGTTPISAKELKAAGYAEMQRKIVETDPPKPSTRLANKTDEIEQIARQRGLEPAAKLGKMIRGDLDWIVGKALEKEPDRRYASAIEFSEDIERYLNSKPVEATPPSAVYRLRKFVRRNRFAAALLLAIVIGSGLSIWQGIKASQQAERALRAEANARAETERANAERVASQAVITNALNSVMMERTYDELMEILALDAISSGLVDSGYSTLNGIVTTRDYKLSEAGKKRLVEEFYKPTERAARAGWHAVWLCNGLPPFEDNDANDAAGLEKLNWAAQQGHQISKEMCYQLKIDYTEPKTATAP